MDAPATLTTPETQPSPPCPPGSKRLYGIWWRLAVVRVLDSVVNEKNQEIERLRAENAQLLDRLVMRAGATPLSPELRHERENGGGYVDPSVRRQFKPLIAAHNAAAQAEENARVMRRLSVAEAERRARIRADAADAASTAESKT